MPASDHLGQQFTTWYHGTSTDQASQIKRSGLTASTYGGEVDDHGPLAYNPTLTSNRDRAATYATAGRAKGAPASVVEFHVPHHLADEYLVNEGRVAGINKPLPPGMVHQVHEL